MNEDKKKIFVDGYEDFYKISIIRTPLNKLIERVKYFNKHNKYLNERRRK